MDKGKFEIRIGTSGWHYDHWVERFYPVKLPKSKWLNYYLEHFDTVEINNTFYQLPKEKTFINWYEKAPKNFIYTVKANRFITHIKKLKDTSESLEMFFKRIQLLREKLGPVLYQLPPNFHKDLKTLQSFIKLLPEDYTNVFEFRHKSWYTEEVFDLLNQYRIVFCIHDMPGVFSPRIITNDVIYIRFHGTTGKYQGKYPESSLGKWAVWIKDNINKVRAVYIYFNNDYEGYALDNAGQLRKLLTM
ncbi:MAG: DUF72 domain-containing protein [Planctomycetota bacterium]|jgi:uncharacterized protein YecE (DUF72 family)